MGPIRKRVSEAKNRRRPREATGEMQVRLLDENAALRKKVDSMEEKLDEVVRLMRGMSEAVGKMNQ